MQACWLRLGFVVVVAASLVGCSEEIAKAVVPAAGTLTIDGVGAANVMVRFVPDGNEIDGNLSSSAVTDQEGHFRLVATDGRDGAIPGPGHVLLVDLNEERPAQGEETFEIVRRRLFEPLTPDAEWLAYNYSGFCNAIAISTVTPGDLCIVKIATGKTTRCHCVFVLFAT